MNDGLLSLDLKKTYHRVVAHSQAKMMEMVITTEVTNKEEMVKGSGDKHF